VHHRPGQHHFGAQLERADLVLADLERGRPLFGDRIPLRALNPPPVPPVAVAMGPNGVAFVPTGKHHRLAARAPSLGAPPEDELPPSELDPSEVEELIGPEGSAVVLLVESLEASSPSAVVEGSSVSDRTARYAILEGRPRLGGTWDLFPCPDSRSDSEVTPRAGDLCRMLRSTARM